MGAEHRAKIANSQILRGLIEFAEGKHPPDMYPPHRVTAALGLLKKVMPDLTQSDITSDGDRIDMPSVIILKAAGD